MRFIDRVRIQIRAGDGGDGLVAWRRESHVPKGGPAGGDGGNGGDIVFEADDQVATLMELKFRQHLKADSGRRGGTARKNGRGGEDLVVRVPVGTAVYFEGEASAHGERPPWLDDAKEGILWVPDEDSRDAEAPVADAETPVADPETPAADPDPETPAEDAEAPAADPEVSAVNPEAPADPDDLPADPEREVEEAGIENVWIVDGRVVDAPSVDDLTPAQQDLLEAGVPLEVVTELPHGETITGGAQRRHLRDAQRRKREEGGPRYDRGDLIGDLDQFGDILTVARGGRGGRGNVHFRSSTNRSPDRAEPGTEGEAMWLRLELKLLADVGIVGYPNVGKSTLISAISRARPEIGAYPFTTLTPQLGVVSLSDERTMVVADVPGLVDGASEGRGLGHEFLRHLERTRVLLHLLAPDPTPGREPLADLEALEGELRRYGPMFEGRPRVVALNKVDTPEGEAFIKRTRRALRARKIPLFAISAATGEGTDALLEALWRRLERVRKLEHSRADEH